MLSNSVLRFCVTALMGLTALCSLIVFSGCKDKSSALVPGDIQESIILAGDAGNTKPDAINTLAQHAQLLSDRTSVYFMGDNIYPAGLPDAGTEGYNQALERLNRQISIFSGLKVRAFFIPGNHDWQQSGPNGYRYIKNQENAVVSALGMGSFAPSQGCPGPVVVEDRSWVKVVVIDSEWWLRDLDKPKTAASGCQSWDREMVVSRIKEILSSDTSHKPVIFLQHHPLESVGTHARSSACNQDFGCPAYQEMQKKLLEALNISRPLICAAGHDHSLQHLVGDFGCKNFIVSGAMSSPSPVVADARAKFASGIFGFFRVDLMKNSNIRLQAIEIVKGETLGKVGYEVILDNK